MKLNVHKFAQGSVLAKGTLAVTDTTNCGSVGVQYSSQSNCC